MSFSEDLREEDQQPELIVIQTHFKMSPKKE